MSKCALLWQKGGSSLAIDETTEYELLADYTVSGAATTRVDFNGLDIGKDDECFLVIDSVAPSACAYSAFINNNIIATNYYLQLLVAQSTSVAGARENNAQMSNISINCKTFILCHIKLTNNGYYINQSEGSRDYYGGSILIQDHYITSTFTTDKITSLNIISSVASAIGIGSRFQLYRVRQEAVQTWVTV